MRLFLRNPNPANRTHWCFPPDVAPPFDPSLGKEARRHMANKQRAKQVRVIFTNGYTDIADGETATIKFLIDSGMCWPPVVAAAG
jgi:hypothetical protein